MKCLKCQATYIGSTKRPLHQRIKEHYQSPASSIYNHRNICEANFEVIIIATDHKINRLRLKEAIVIRDNNPAINNKSEREELLNLIV